MRPFIAITTLLFPIFLCVSSQGQVRFAPLSFQGNQPELTILGADRDVIIQSSINLTNWSFLHSGSPSNGVFSFLDLRGATNKFQFYRAFTTNSSVPVGRTVVLQVNTNAMVTTLIGGEGGSLDLAIENGATVTLTIPSNVVVNPGYVTMTQVTNITGLPFARGMLAAVQITTTNLALFGAAILEITFPTGTTVDRREVLSFTSDQDGSGFVLAADRVGAASTLIPVTTPGMFGAAVASTEELNQFEQPQLQAQQSGVRTGRLSALQAGDLSDFLAASVNCFTERVVAAVDIGDRLRAELAAVSQRIAVSRARARRAQNADAADDPVPVDQAGLEACIFYHDRIRPLFPVVQNNCSLLRVLAGVTISLSRQLQLLGYSDCASLVTLADLPVCAGARACLDEIEQCCGQDPQNRQQYRTDLVGIIRQQQLLGVEGQPGCFTLESPDVQRILRECTDVGWNGWIRVVETGSAQSEFGPSKRFRDLSVEYHGFVTRAENDPTNFFGLTLGFAGELSSSDKRININVDPCGRGCGDEFGVAERSGQGDLSAEINIKGTPESGSYQLTIVSYGVTPGRNISRGVEVSCTQCVAKNTRTVIQSVDAVRPNILINYQGAWSDPNRIAGSTTTTNNYDGTGQATTTFSWSLFRNSAQ